MASNTLKNPDTGDGPTFQPPAHHDHVVFKASALQTVSIPDSPPADEEKKATLSSHGDNTIGVVESVPLASPAPMNPPTPSNGIVAPTPQPFHASSHGFAFTPMGSTSQTPAQDTFPSEFESRSSSPNQAVSLSRQTSFSASNPASRIQSRRGSSYAPHPMATGPPARPPLRTGGDSGMQGTPSLLSRAGSPTLPLMSDKTRSRSSSFVGAPGDAFGAGFGQGAFGMSALRGTKKAGEFVGSVDCGTTSTRFIVFDKFGRIITEHQTEFPQIHPHPGWHEHDPQAILSSVETCIAKAVEKLEWMGYAADTIKAIGITNQRETTLCWDKETGKAWEKCNAIVWDDVRNVGLVREFQKKLDEEGLEIYEDEEEEAKEGKERAKVVNGDADVDGSGGMNGYLGKLMNGLGVGSILPSAAENTKVETDSEGRTFLRRKGSEALKDITGIPLSTYFSAIKLRWMIDHRHEIREAYEQDRLAFGTVDSWLVFNLSGAKNGGLHIMDCTNASRTLLMDMRTLNWSPTLLRFFGLKESILPKIVSSSEVYGNVANGPLKGVPIAGMIGDQQAALVGNKCLSKGEAKNTYGTGAFVLFNTGNEFVRSQEGLISTVGYKLGKEGKATYALEGSIAVAGSAIKWLRDQMGLIEESSEMDDLCSSVKDCGGVYFVTAFSGLLAPYWDPNASGMIIGLTQYSTASHIARAVLEAACYQTRAVLDVIEKESGVKLEVLKVDGGVTNSDLAMQLQADIGGFKVCRPQMRESTALGSALLAGSATGLFGWDLSKPETLAEVNSQEAMFFEPEIPEALRLKKIKGWERAVSRAKAWHTAEDEDEAEAGYEKEDGY